MLLLATKLERPLGEVLLLHGVLIVGLTIRLQHRVAERTHRHVLHVHDNADAAVLVSGGLEVVPVALHHDLHLRTRRALVLLQRHAVRVNARSRRSKLALRERGQSRRDERRAEHDFVLRAVAERLAEERLKDAFRQRANAGREVRGDVLVDTTDVTNRGATARVQVANAPEQRVLKLTLMLDQLLLRLVSRLRAAIQLRRDQRVRKSERITLDLRVVVVGDLLRLHEGTEGRALSSRVADLHEVNAARSRESSDSAKSARDGDGVSSRSRNDSVLARGGEAHNVVRTEVTTRAGSDRDVRVGRSRRRGKRRKARHQLVAQPLDLLRVSCALADLLKHRRQRSLVRLKLRDGGGHINDALVRQNVRVVNDPSEDSRHSLSFLLCREVYGILRLSNGRVGPHMVGTTTH